jgi:hypothetical protein
MAKLTLVKLKCTGSNPEFQFQAHFKTKSGASIGNPIMIHPSSQNVVNIQPGNNNPHNVSLFNLKGSRLFLTDLNPNPDKSYGGGVLDATIGASEWTPIDVPGYDVEIFYTVKDNAFSLTQSYLIKVAEIVSAFIQEIAIATTFYFTSLFTLLTLPFRRSRRDEEIDQSSNNVQTDLPDRSQDDSQDNSQ